MTSLVKQQSKTKRFYGINSKERGKCLPVSPKQTIYTVEKLNQHHNLPANKQKSHLPSTTTQPVKAPLSYI